MKQLKELFKKDSRKFSQPLYEHWGKCVNVQEEYFEGSVA